VEVTPCAKCGKAGPAADAVCPACGARKGIPGLSSTLEHLKELLGPEGKGQPEPEWVVVVKVLALVASLIVSLALAVLVVRATDELLPSSTWGLAALTVVFFTGVGFCGGLIFFALGAILSRLSGAKPVPFRTVGYLSLLGLSLGLLCVAFVLRRTQ
jgi:hypothetical protein